MESSNSYEILKNDIFAFTPFFRELIIMDSDCKTEPIIPFKEYSVFVFNSLLEPILRNKFDFVSMVFRDIPFNGKMVSTVQLLDTNGDFIKLSSDHINWIQNHINNIVKYDSKFFNFFNLNDCNIFRPWVRVIFPLMKLKRMDNDQLVDIKSKLKNNFLLLDLSEDIDYFNTTMNLYPQINYNLESLFENGLIPKSSNSTLLKNIDDFSYIYENVYNGEETFEKLLSIQQELDLPSIVIPNQKLLLNEQSTNKYTVYKIYLGETESYPFNNIIGSYFLSSLKKFLDADQIVTLQKKDHYEISVWKNNELIESDVNINDFFGKMYFTDDVRGLLVLDKLNMMNIVSVIQDGVSKKKGLFLPIMMDGEIIQEVDLISMLENYKSNVDVYDQNVDEIREKCFAFELDIIGEIFFDEIEYLFVNKDNLVTQRALLRSLGNPSVDLIIDGIWIDENYSVDECDTVITKVYGDNYIRGPYKTYYLSFMNRDDIDTFERKIFEYFDKIKDKTTFLYG